VKILEKWGPGCVFYGADPDTNLQAFEAFLMSSNCDPPRSRPPVAAVFCECPSNPLLQFPNLLRLRELADNYGFLVIIDDTIGNFVNVNVLQYADVMTTSLSKLFSGAADVMGGR
jgi:cystathionine gamma-synthase